MSGVTNIQSVFFGKGREIETVFQSLNYDDEFNKNIFKILIFYKDLLF